MELNNKEQRKYDVIEKVINNELSTNEASELLNLSTKQIRRLKNIFINEGKDGFSHKNKGKSNKNKTLPEKLDEIKNLYIQEYFDYNLIAFYEEIEEKYNISYSVMYRAFIEDDIVSPIAHKKTIKLYNEKMDIAISNDNLQTISESKKELYEIRKISSEKARFRRSSNLYVFGQELQLDASIKIWFGNLISALHLAVDKATKKVLFGWFEYEEITRGYYIVLMHIITNYGIPHKIKADNRSSFSTNKKDDKLNTTQFGRICNYLDIILDTSSNPTFKANVERENGTFKNRLIAELRHEKITDIDKANYYLNNIFIPKMNRKFSYQIDETTSMMKENNYTKEELNLIISERYSRIIDNASSISYNNKHYIPVDAETGEIVAFKSKTECLVVIAYDYTYWCKIENNYYKLLEIETRNGNLEKDNDCPQKLNYNPPVDQPWRKSPK